MPVDLSHVRHGIGSVRPYLQGPVELLDFVRKTFGAVELERREFGPETFHVELQIGDSVIVIEGSRRS
jgi:PhnB protein